MNLGEAPVQLVAASIQNSLPDVEHVVLQSAQTLELPHKRCKTFGGRYPRHQRRVMHDVLGYQVRVWKLNPGTTSLNQGMTIGIRDWVALCVHDCFHLTETFR